MIKIHQKGKGKTSGLSDKNGIAKSIHNYVNENKDYLWKRVNYILLKKVMGELQTTGYREISQEWLRDFIYQVLRDDVVGVTSVSLSIEHQKLSRQFEKYKKEVKNSKQTLKEKIIRLQDKTHAYQSIADNFYRQISSKQPEERKNLQNYKQTILFLNHQLQLKQRKLNSVESVFQSYLKNRQKVIRGKKQEIQLLKAVILELKTKLNDTTYSNHHQLEQENRKILIDTCKMIHQIKEEKQSQKNKLISQFWTQIHSLRQKMDSKDTQIARLKNDSSESQNLRKQINQTQTQINQKKQIIEALEKETVQKDKKIVSLEKKNKSLNERINQEDVKRQRLQEQLEGMKTQSFHHRAQIERASSNQLTLKNQNKSLLEQIAFHKQQNAHLQQQIQIQQQKINQLTLQLQDEQDEYQDQNYSNYSQYQISIVPSVDEKGERIKQLEEMIYAYNMYINTTMNSTFELYSNLIPTLSQLKLQNQTLTKMLEKRESQNESLQNEIEELKGKYRICMSEYSQLAKKLSLMENINTSLQSQLDSLKDCQRCLQLNGKLAELEKVNGQLQETIQYANSLFMAKSKETSPEKTQKSFESQTNTNSDEDLSTIHVQREGVDRATIVRYLLQFLDKDNKEEKKISILNTLCETLKIEGEEYRRVEQYMQKKKVEIRFNQQERDKGLSDRLFKFFTE